MGGVNEIAVPLEFATVSSGIAEFTETIDGVVWTTFKLLAVGDGQVQGLWMLELLSFWKFTNNQAPLRKKIFILYKT